MNRVVFDVETASDITDEMKQILYEGIKPRANIKDPVKIQADLQEKYQAKVERAALDPWMARVRVITACNLDAGAEGEKDHVQVWASDTNEVEVLFGFAAWLSKLRGGYKVIGFNIARFDIPMLNIRMMRHKIAWRTPFPAHQRDYKRYFDLMTVLDGHKLDHWLRLFGLPVKIADGNDTLNMNIDDTVKYAHAEMESMVLLTRLMGDSLNVMDLL